MRSVRAVKRGFFPLDEELQLLAGHYTPTVYEDLTRLATWMPFARAVKEVAYFRRTSVTEATVRRQTEAAGAAYVAVQQQAVERLERETPPAPKGPEQQFLSVDGAFVPLVGGEWAEVKTVVIGEVEPPKHVKDEIVIQTRALSYFSRLTDSTTFQRLALVETHRRGVQHRRRGRCGHRWRRVVSEFCGLSSIRCGPDSRLSPRRRTSGTDWSSGLRGRHRCH